jgi:hypothetical protein
LIKKSLYVIASEAKQSKGVQRNFPLVGAWGSKVIIRLDRMIQMAYPPALKVPQDWGIRGLLETISEIYKNTERRKPIVG